MNIFPLEIQTLIFEFDCTYKEKFDQVIHHIRFIPILENLLEWTSDPLFVKDRAKCVRLILHCKKTIFHEFPNQIENIKNVFWKNYIHDNVLKKRII